MNVNVGISNDPATGKPSGGSISGSVSDYDREQVDRATVGDGEILVRNTEEQTQDVAALNRDLEKAQEITKDESSGVDFYASTTAIEELASGFETTRNNLENLANAGTLIPQNLQKAKQELSNVITDSLGRFIQDNKFNLNEKKQIGLAALGYATGDLTDEIIRNSSCSSQNGNLKHYIIDFFITTAYAHSSGICTVKGVSGRTYIIPHGSEENCIDFGRYITTNPETVKALGNYIETSLVSLGKAPEDVAQVLQDLRDNPLDTLRRLGPTLVGIFPPNMPMGAVAAETALSRDLAELAAKGVKFNPQNVLATTRTPSGQIVFIETGNANAGLGHIVAQHAQDFANIGVSETGIVQLLMRALREGNIVGYQGAGVGRPIYETLVNGVSRRIAITVGNNGFVVGANPAGRI